MNHPIFVDTDATYQLVPDTWEVTFRIGDTVCLKRDFGPWPTIPAGTTGQLVAMEVTGESVAQGRPLMVVFNVNATLAELYPRMFCSGAAIRRMDGTHADPEERMSRLTLNMSADALDIIKPGEGATFAEIAASHLARLMPIGV